MSDPVTILWWLLAVVGLVGSALCSGLEVGFYSVSRVLIRVRASAHKGAGQLQRQLESPVSVLTTLLAYNNIFNYIATLAITALLSRTGWSDSVIIVCQAAVLTPVILIFGESIPKELFRSRANTIMERLGTMLMVMRVGMTVVPVVPIINAIVSALSKLLGADLRGEVRSARETMTDLIKHGDDRITQSQSELIDRALTLDQTPVVRVMVPIASAARMSKGMGRPAAIDSAKRLVHSRYPVHDAEGVVIGCVGAVDLHTSDDPTIDGLIRPVTRIRSGDSVRTALRALSASGDAMGVVTRKGREIGIVTRKDLLAPLLGVGAAW